MPQHTRVVTTNPEALRLTEAMKNYFILMESCSQCVRMLPNSSELYKEAVEKWRHRSEFYRPRRGDEAERARFFSAVDKACKIESRDPENCYLIIFACSAAIQDVIEQDLVKLPEPDRLYVMGESKRVSTEQLKAQMGLPPTVKTSAASQHRPKQAFEELDGEQVLYQDPKTGKTRLCTVTNQITSLRRGRYYVITDSDGADVEVNEDEMQDMLDKPIQ